MAKIPHSLKDDLLDLFDEGPEKVHILADFDGTLTKEFVGGKKLPSIISVLRDHPKYLSPDYQQAAKALYNTYGPLEHDAKLSLAERKAKMREWWTKHFRLLIDSGLTRNHLEQVANSGIIQFREGAKEFLKLTHQLGVPVVVFSASGLGESIPIYCHHEKIDTPNVHFLINRFKWDKDGRAVGRMGPIIHSLNKDETAISDYSDIHEGIKDRVNVLLLGNGIGDLGMIKGFKPKKKVTIGFLDPEETNRKTDLEKHFRHVIVGGCEQINEILSTLDS